MDADTPSHTSDTRTDGADSCCWTVHPILQGRWSLYCDNSAWSRGRALKGVRSPRLGAATCGRCDFRLSSGLCLLSWKLGIVTPALSVLQGACGSQMRSRAGNCPADSKVWSNYEGLRLLLLSTHSNYSGSGGNKHTPSPRSRD